MNELNPKFFKKRKIPVYKLPWNVLTSNQKSLRKRSLEVLSEVRKGKKSLSKSAKQNKISPKSVINNTDAFRKKRRRWSPKKFDRISRIMVINEFGDSELIEVNDSRTAAIIGRYHAAVKQFLNTGNSKKLSEFKDLKIKDKQGNIHTLDTDPKTVIETNERIEEVEFYEIYATQVSSN